MSLWSRVRDSVFSDPEQISTLKSFFRIILFQIGLLCVSIFFGFILAIATSPILKSFSLAVIVSNVIYHVIFFIADIGGDDTSGYTSSISGDVGSDPGEWQPFKVLKVWYAIVISILSIIFYSYVFV